MTEQEQHYIFVLGAYTYDWAEGGTSQGDWVGGVPIGEYKCKCCGATMPTLGEWETPQQEYIRIECDYCRTVYFRMRQSTVAPATVVQRGSTVIHNGSGSVATDGGVAASHGGVAVGGSVHGPITTSTHYNKKGW